eukprot:5126077-Prymnesium_polylepis.1
MFLITKGRDFMKTLYKHVAEFAASNNKDFLIGVQEANEDYFRLFVADDGLQPAPAVMYTQSGPEGSTLIFDKSKFTVPSNSQFKPDPKDPSLYMADFHVNCWKKPMGRKWKKKEGLPTGVVPFENDELVRLIQSKLDPSKENVVLSDSEFASLGIRKEPITAETHVQVGKVYYVPDSFTWQENIRDDPWTVWNGGRTVLITSLLRGQNKRQLNILNVHSFNPSSDASKMKYDDIEKFAAEDPPREREMEFDDNF